MVEMLILPRKPSLLVPHHSLADWDMSSSAWRITTLQYVSSPSSIEWSSELGVLHDQLCCNDACLNIPQGRLISWFKIYGIGSIIGQTFRNTAPVGTANRNNCYYTYFGPYQTSWTLYEYENGAETRSWSTTKTAQAEDIWHRYRLSWAILGWELTVTLEWWDGSAWIQQGDIITVTDPLFGDEAIQRTGLETYNGGEWNLWIDDTEIYKRQA